MDSPASTSYDDVAESQPVEELPTRSFAHIRPNNAQFESLDSEIIVAQKEISETEVDFYKEQDRFLPIANVGRIMKKCLPVTTKVSKDSKECVQECTSEFISFITSEAAEKCAQEKRKTINGEDILFAMESLGFENYAQVLTIYLAKYREYQRVSGRRQGKKAKAQREAEERKQGENLEEEIQTEELFETESQPDKTFQQP